MLTVEDFFVTSVSSDKDMGKRPAKILMSDKKALFLPTEMSAIHLEHTEYFFDHKTSIASKCWKFLLHKGEVCVLTKWFEGVQL